MSRPEKGEGPSMRTCQITITLLLFSTILGCRTPGVENPKITRTELVDHVSVLASDRMQGRAVGTAGFDSAAAYVAGQLYRAGVLPGATNERGEPTYFQPVPLLHLDAQATCELTFATIFDTLRLSTANNGLLLVHPGSRREPFTASGPLMDAGHAIRGDSTHDELAWVNPAGGILLLDLSTPASWRNGLSDSLDALYRNPTYAMRMRLENLKSAAVVLIPVHPKKDLLWRRLVGTRPFLPVVLEDLTGVDGIPSPHPAVFLVDADTISAVLSRRSMPNPDTGFRTGGIITGIKALISVDVPAERVASPNVIGLVPGSDPALADEVITVTAHLDHMGADGLRIFHGANDNASGVSALLEVAEALAVKPPSRSVLFIITAGEEAGFFGATYWILHPTISLTRVIAEINLDEVGRTPMNPLGIVAIGTDDLKDAFARAVEKLPGVTISWLPPDSYGMFFMRSDQVVFYRAGIPSIYLTTGEFPEYHTPADTADLISGNVLQQCAKILGAFLYEVGNSMSLPGK
ncbi:MAG: M28 family peptidase [bacterium]